MKQIYKISSKQVILKINLLTFYWFCQENCSQAECGTGKRTRFVVMRNADMECGTVHRTFRCDCGMRKKNGELDCRCAEQMRNCWSNTLTRVSHPVHSTLFTQTLVACFDSERPTLKIFNTDSESQKFALQNDI